MHFKYTVVLNGMLSLLAFCIFSGCALNGAEGNAKIGKAILSDISYDKNKKNPDAYTVYIQEDDLYKPYLVISGNYSGRCLVLRKDLLDEKLVFNNEKSQGSYGSYYLDSEIDTYINTIYFARLSAAMRNSISETSIKISTRENVRSGSGVGKTENIKRKIFLLSATEINVKSIMASNEGAPLSYFRNTDNLIAFRSDGEAGDYWLRSAYHWDDIQSWAVTYTGICTGFAVSEELHARPAFCLPSDSAIRDESINGKSVYVIEP